MQNNWDISYTYDYEDSLSLPVKNIAIATRISDPIKTNQYQSVMSLINIKDLLRLFFAKQLYSAWEFVKKDADSYSQKIGRF